MELVSHNLAITYVGRLVFPVRGWLLQNEGNSHDLKRLNKFKFHIL